MSEPSPPDVVLVVDDDPLNLMLLARLLKDAGCTVMTASTGREALSLAASASLVLLDISLPDLEGHEIAATIRSQPATVDLPIIFITSHKEQSEKTRAFGAGASDYITKPFDLEEVRLRVFNQLQIARMRHEIEAQNRELRRKNEEMSRTLSELRRQEDLLTVSEKELHNVATQLTSSRESFARVFSALSEVLPGTVLDGRYRLDSLIGSGGFGAVYRARHLVLDRPIAVKVLQPPQGPDAAQQLESFHSEAVSAFRFNHPNAVSVLDAGVSTSGLPYIVMEYLEGWSAREELNNSGRLTLKRCAEIMVPVCEVIARAHGAGVTHRDIKPDNIFVDMNAESETVKVLDFGLAKLHHDAESADQQGPRIVSGTPPYMSPESFTGKVADPTKIDVYAIAAVTFEFVCGRPPFLGGEGGIRAFVAQHMAAAPPRPSEIVPGLGDAVDELLLSGLAKDPEARPSVRAFGEQLILATLSASDDMTDEERDTLKLTPLDE